MMPMRIRRKGSPMEKLENPTALQRRGRSCSQLSCKSDHACVSMSDSSPRAIVRRVRRSRHIVMAGLDPAIHVLPHKERECPGRRLAEAALAAQRDKPGHDGVLVSQREPLRKIAPRTSLAGYERFPWQSCGKLREIEPSGRTKSANFCAIGPKFLAVQRHTF